MEIRRVFFADTVSSTTVQLRRHLQIGQNPDARPGQEILQANLVLEGTAEADFWAANCTKYEVIIRRLT